MNFYFFIFLFWCNFIFANQLPSNHFPVPSVVRAKADFWKKVYTEINDDQGYIHSAAYPGVIFETIKASGMSERVLDKNIAKIVASIKAHGNEIIKKKGRNLTQSEKRLMEQAQGIPLSSFPKLISHIRFQRGMRNRYYDGLVRSYAYLDFIKKEFRKNKMPEQLAYLPHVESSFNYKAYSKVGAAGVWQFMRPTARLYRLKMDKFIDERRDPHAATMAAVWYLKDNFRQLKTWPLALTAYNHGPNSIARAVKEVGSRDIEEVLDNYKRSSFGFASKNFYATYIAAAEIASNPKMYFPNFKEPPAENFNQVKLRTSAKPTTIAKALNINVKTFESLNLALRPVVFKSDWELPAGMMLKVPQNIDISEVELAFRIANIHSSPEIGRNKTQNKISQNLRFYNFEIKHLKNQHHIQLEAEETLDLIANWSQLDLNELLAMNNASTEFKIGQTLKTKIKDISHFNAERQQFHLAIQEDFFANYKVVSSKLVTLKKNQSIEMLLEEHQVPLWLYRQELASRSLAATAFSSKRGGKIRIPHIVKR